MTDTFRETFNRDYAEYGRLGKDSDGLLNIAEKVGAKQLSNGEREHNEYCSWEFSPEQLRTFAKASCAERETELLLAESLLDERIYALEAKLAKLEAFKLSVEQAEVVAEVRADPSYLHPVYENGERVNPDYEKPRLYFLNHDVPIRTKLIIKPE